jgi:hypothetical protein
VTVKIVTSWQTLMHYAHALGQARLRGTPEQVAQAKAEYDSYAQMCLDADEMHCGTVGDLFDTRGRR